MIYRVFEFGMPDLQIGYSISKHGVTYWYVNGKRAKRKEVAYYACAIEDTVQYQFDMLRAQISVLWRTIKEALR